jgi:hypothetical protein
MPDPVCDVSPDGDEWVVKKRGSERAFRRFDRKADAVKIGRGLAKRQQGQVVIRKKDGTIQEERTYGKDPFPPKG